MMWWNRCGLFLLILACFCAREGQCRLPDNLREGEYVFIYVHGMGETRAVLGFDEKMREFLKPLPLKARVVVWRWDRMRINLTKVVHQWTTSKDKTDAAAADFFADLQKLEAAKVNYAVIGFSLGCRVVAGALQRGKAPLQYLRSVTFMGAALPHDYGFRTRCLPDGMMIDNYYSSLFDEVLKISFYNAEGKKAAGEVGFDDTTHFRNLRTVCTHVHKGGPIQRDYSNLAGAIGYLTFFRNNILVRGAPVSFNIESRVLDGDVHWNDIAEFDAKPDRILIQQNANTYHYRAVAIGKDGKRLRRAWGENLHALLEALDLFPGPYQEILIEGVKKN